MSESTNQTFTQRELGTRVIKYIDVAGRARELGLNVPESLCFLPRNFDTVSSAAELLHESSVSTIRILFRQSELSESRLEPDGVRIREIKENNFELILPTLFVAASVYSQNPELINIALGVLANYATDFFKGIAGKQTTRLSIVHELPNRRTVKIDYAGGVAGIKELNRIVETLNNDKS